MLENLFLDYANLSLRDNPENLLKIFEEILPCFEDDPEGRASLESILTHIVHYAKFDDRNLADDHLLEVIAKKLDGHRPDLRDEYELAFDAVYGEEILTYPPSREYLNEACPDYSHCPVFLDIYGEPWYYEDDDQEDALLMKELLGRQGLIGDERIRCHECTQLGYVYHLSNLAHKKLIDEATLESGYLWVDLPPVFVPPPELDS